MMKEKRIREALERFLKAVEADTRNPRAYKLAGDCYLLLGGKDQAAAAYRKSLEWNPQDNNLRNWLNTYAPTAQPKPLSPLPALPAPGAGAPAPAPAAAAPSQAVPVAAAPAATTVPVSSAPPTAAPATSAAPSGMPVPGEGQ
jgi:tetratricopeptide (TPR) repeat protein